MACAVVHGGSAPSLTSLEGIMNMNSSAPKGVRVRVCVGRECQDLCLSACGGYLCLRVLAEGGRACLQAVSLLHFRQAFILKSDPP